MISLDKIFDRTDKKQIKSLEKIVSEIDKLESKIKSLSDEQLKGKTNEFKERLANGETLDDILIEAFAVVREASSRVLGMRQYPVQLIGGIVLHQGKIAEMKTGEGKTLVGVAPVYLNALSGEGVHVVTVNDYLAKRDKEIMQPLYEFLGLTVGVILHGQEVDERRKQYNCDITYGTNNEYGFDYLKDNMVHRKEDMVQRKLNYAIVDEIDSILIDEARTPLIISGEIPQDEKIYRIVNVFMKMLLNEDVEKDEKDKKISLTEKGIKKAESFFKVDNIVDSKNIELYHHINKALTAYGLMKRDIDYVVKDGEIMIVDEFTGRVMEGRRFSEGLHQAIEAKENLEIRNESKTLATITFQNYFRMYKKLSGMTGTAKTEEKEFNSTYKMEVVQIPTNKPVIRKDLEDIVYKTEEDKFNAVINKIEEVHKTKQPILVGTASISKSEILSHMLTKKGLKHEVLNAKNHEREAEIVAKAGSLGAITIATNMAGRGTDISLGAGDKKQEEKVKELGGLYVIGTERHETRRIDNQLRGRAGRQGDPGVSRFYISLEDDIMRLYGSLKSKKLGEKSEKGKPIEHKSVIKTVEEAQKLLESKNFGIRKNVIQYDDVINEQRQTIYKDRYKILNGDDISSEIKIMAHSAITDAYNNYIEENNDIDEYIRYINRLFKVNKHNIDMNLKDINKQEIVKYTTEIIEKIYDDNSSEELRSLERNTLISVVDNYWTDHIDALDQLKQGIGLMAVGQKDPVKEFTIQSFDLFNKITNSIKLDTLNYLYGFIVK